MAHFIGKVHGARGQVTRLGHGSMHTEANGWDFGVKVNLYQKDGEDRAEIYLTGGSRGNCIPVIIGDYSRADLDAMLKVSVSR